MSTQIAALSGEYLDPKSFRFARTQREAGIEHLEWEDRMKPLRPLSHDVVLGLSLVATAAACLFI
jgi:hypothetical protein